MRLSKNTWTVLLLCVSYAMDFYNLTIFPVSYHDIITESFGIYDSAHVQQIRLSITNWQNLGIIVGALVFGVLGDKIGRTSVIKYSIFLYAVSTLLCVYTSDIGIFSALRFLAGVGLACEFATSNVLIAELLPAKWANICSALLYFCGILGGVLASTLGFISWEILFYVGSAGGFIILLLRKNMRESGLLLALITQKSGAKRGRISEILQPSTLLKTLKFYVMNIGFHALITFMFFYPQYMDLGDTPFAQSVKFLLLYFFAGGLVGTIAVAVAIYFWKNYARYMLWNTLLALCIMPLFPLITTRTFALYCLLIGFIAGGYPIAWIQFASKSYGTNIRNTATNLLFAMGRWTGILLNLLMSFCISYGFDLERVIIFSSVCILVMGVLVIMSLKNNYYKSLDYVQ